MIIKGGEYVSELVKRTWENYLFIKNKAICDKDGASVYEVTQLINSMYCMLVVPQQIFGMFSKDPLPEVRRQESNLKSRSKDEHDALLKVVEELKSKGRLYYNGQSDRDTTCPVCTLIYNLRNAICHNGVGFMPVDADLRRNPNSRITDIVFETRRKRKDINGKETGEDKVIFMAKFEISTLETFLENVGKVYVKAEGRSRDSDPYIKLFQRIHDDCNRYLRAKNY